MLCRVCAMSTFLALACTPRVRSILDALALHYPLTLVSLVSATRYMRDLMIHWLNNFTLP